ncbi:ceramide kinase isoform X2 [Danio rerio]|uniref:Ceramide kinase isoform X2 n=1 Tax=Danio rerio TaxID=7955 RepID=A0AC58J773_DANRE
MEKQSTLLCSELSVQRRLYEVTLNCAILAWKDVQNAKKHTGRAIYGAVKAGSHCVPVCEIIAVQEKEDDSPCKDTGKWQKVPQSPTDSCQHAFTVYYVERTRQHCWRCSNVTFQCSEHSLCLLWIQTIKEQLALLTNRPVEKQPIQCWRCSGPHPPGNCPMYLTPPSQQSSTQHHPNHGKSFHAAKSGGRPTNIIVAASETPQSTKEVPNVFLPSTTMSSLAIPQQLVVPISIGSWFGKAILDTGASYTLIHESLMQNFDTSAQLQNWSSGPLYLANGKAEIPLGWLNITIQIHGKSFVVPAVVLPSQALAYAIILGLDFIFFSGLKIHVSEHKYSFTSDPTEEHPFQPGYASEPLVKMTPMTEKKTLRKNKLNLTLLSAVPPPQTSLGMLQTDHVDDATQIWNAVSEAQLPKEEKQQLLQILQNNPRVCTQRTGKTKLLQHRIYTTSQVPIKQKPYRLSPVKQQVMEEQLEQMLRDGIVEPSHSSWASPVVLVPKKNGKLRFCVDYRKVNAITENDAYPLPNITEILESLSGSTIFFYHRFKQWVLASDDGS